MSITQETAQPDVPSPALAVHRSRLCAAAGLRIVPGGHAVLFDQDVWHFGGVDGLPAHLELSSIRFDFTAVTDRRWRLLAKEYIFARLAPADPAVAVLPAAYRVPLTLSTCTHRLTEAASWLNWLTGQQTESLGQVTQDQCDRYLAERARRKNTSGQVTGTLDDGSLRVPAAVITDLAGSANYSPPTAIAKASPPGGGGPPRRSSACDRAGRTRRRRWASRSCSRCSPRRSMSPKRSASTS